MYIFLFVEFQAIKRVYDEISEMDAGLGEDLDVGLVKRPFSRPLKVIFKQKNLCDGFLKDCLNFADNSIYFQIGKESVSISIGKAECLEKV